MRKYYKLSVLRETNEGAAWESFYLEMDWNKSKIVLHYAPSEIMGRVLNSKLERITEEETKKAISNSNIDHGH
jgi:hypothetical protein